jgi:uncharacterized protein
MTNHDVSNLKLVHNEAAARWEAHVDQQMGVTQYQRRGDALAILHVEVPPALRGRGVAGRLVEAALDDARARALSVIPYCSYAAAYMRRHPEYATLVPPEHRYLLGETQVDRSRV